MARVEHSHGNGPTKLLRLMRMCVKGAHKSSSRWIGVVKTHRIRVSNSDSSRSVVNND